MRFYRHTRARPDLEEQLLAVDVVDQQGVVLVHHGQLVARGAHVQAAHRRRQLEQRDGELVVDKDLQDLRHTCQEGRQRD